jgi:hypothetical protein
MARARVSARTTSSTAWVPWRLLPALRLSPLRGPVPAAQDGVAAVVAAFPAVGLAAVAAVRSKAAAEIRQRLS